jgi:hypothetical protein
MTLFRRLRPSCAKASNHRTFLQLLGASSQLSDPHGHLPQWTCRGWKSNTSFFTHRIAKELCKGFWPSMLSLWPLDEITWCRGNVERSKLKRTEIGQERSQELTLDIGSEPWWVEPVEPVEPARKRQLHRHRSSPPRQPRKVHTPSQSQLFSQRLVDISRLHHLQLFSRFIIFWISGLSSVKSFKLFCQIFLLHPYMSNWYGSCSPHVYICV